MHITLSPVRLDETLTASLTGDVLTLNGQPFDFTQLPEGGTLPADAIASEWIVGPVSRINGELRLTLRLPYISDGSHFAPEPIHVTEDGPIPLPLDPEPEPEVIEEPVVEEGVIEA
ncbi:hypothetical protein [Stutzerimonas xanthomarina]|uniref:Uncharacterized protein n=2 Tax=Stutzerimonas xanthomarina TaxID=271420 RepID=A0A1M5MSE6_9GAMM|nr:hypothetical protein [Stutzerimonas xanthomarina]MCP9337648.1 hypothetical protein [Stutzerimonas xanthomarina]SEH86704.1 hypothetical protein SAMN05216535_2360 [Stutzerimonas xanthomarina]SHG80137.1 hypothetical protein SAMN02744645_1457 [Stutzerimonas xanthomarina DSM 18231]